jgi:hypothetical protein
LIFISIRWHTCLGINVDHDPLIHPLLKLNDEGDEVIMNEDVTREGYEYVLKDEIGSNDEEKDDSDDSEMNEE